MTRDPFDVLGIAPEADDEAVRAAWLGAVRRHPPDRDAAGFREAREAFDLVSSERSRVAYRLFGRPQLRSLDDLARALEGSPRRVGLGPWRAVLRERSR